MFQMFKQRFDQIRLGYKFFKNQTVYRKKTKLYNDVWCIKKTSHLAQIIMNIYCLL